MKHYSNAPRDGAIAQPTSLSSCTLLLKHSSDCFDLALTSGQASKELLRMREAGQLRKVLKRCGEEPAAHSSGCASVLALDASMPSRLREEVPGSNTM